MEKENEDPKNLKTNFTKNQLTSAQQTELEKKKTFLHNLIDGITVADYVEANSRILDVAGGTPQTIHQIVIEKNGNVIIRNKSDIPHHHTFDEDSDEFP